MELAGKAPGLSISTDFYWIRMSLPGKWLSNWGKGPWKLTVRATEGEHLKVYSPGGFLLGKCEPGKGLEITGMTDEGQMHWHCKELEDRNVQQ